MKKVYFNYSKEKREIFSWDIRIKTQALPLK